MDISAFDALDYLGTLAFAISGATLAIKKEFDLFGIFVLAFFTAIGGGTVRDVLIGNTPVEWMHKYGLIVTIITGGLVSIVLNPLMHRLSFFVYLFDAVGLGLFTMAGIQKGVEYELNIFICIALGTITATFGGLLRDIITGEQPMLLTRKEIYAIASALGGLLFFGLDYLGVPESMNISISIVVIILIRHVTYHFNIKLPGYRKIVNKK